MGIINVIFGKNETKKLVFIKPFDNNCKQKEQLENLLNKVGDDQRIIIQRQLDLINIGLMGEQKVAFELQNLYNIHGYVFYDVYLKFDENISQIDFIVVTNRFICVLEAKKLSGNIEIDADGNFIRSFTNSKGIVFRKEGMDSPVMQNKKHCDLLQNLLLSNNLIKDFPIISLVCCSNGKAIIKKSYAPKEIQDIVIKTDQLSPKLKTFYDLNANKEIKDKKVEAIVEFISNHIVDYEVDYISKLRLNVMETKIQEKVIQTSENLVETVKEEVVVEVNQDDELYVDLVKYRNDKAKQLNYPNYYIFNNDQLEKLILKRPLDKNQLLNCKILNNKQFELYADDIISIIVMHSSNELCEKEKLDNEIIYQKLRAYRYAKSMKNNVKQYYIFNNEELALLVKALPTTKEELMLVRGFNKNKIELYGNEILNIIKKYITKN